MVYFCFNLAKNGPVCEKTYPQKLVTKNRQTPPYPQKLVTGGTPPPSSDIVTTFALFLILRLPLPKSLSSVSPFIPSNQSLLSVSPFNLFHLFPQSFPSVSPFSVSLQCLPLFPQISLFLQSLHSVFFINLSLLPLSFQSPPSISQSLKSVSPFSLSLQSLP